MYTLWQDLRYSLRILLKSPGYACIAIAVLALGIGANTAVFSVINAVLLRPLPYPHPDQLVLVREKMPMFDTGSVSYPNYLDWCAGQRSFTDLAMVRKNSFNVSFPASSNVPPERIRTAEVSANFLTILGIHPELGRDFTKAEDTPGGPKVIALGDAVWRRRFGADRNVLGQRIVVDGVSREIVGVLPPEIGFPRGSEMFVPMGDMRSDENLLDRRNHNGFSALGRLKPGVTVEHAKDDLNAIAVELEKRYPDSNTERRVNPKLLLEFTVGEYRRSLYMLLGAVVCVLLIACANVANLQLARASSRQKELAVRAALGASRWRLMRQMLTESTVLGVLGGGFALLLALWAMDAIIALSPATVPRFQETHLDLTALAFTAAAALGTGLLVGLWPAWRVSGMVAMAAALHEGSARGSSGGSAAQRARSLLVVTQVALAMVLLACAGLTLQGFWTVQNEPLGFNPHGLLTVSISLPEAKYPREKVAPFYNALLDRVRTLPGVESAATGNNVPFDNSEWDSSFHITGTPDYPPGKDPSAEMNFVSTDYFKTMGIPITRGRDFDSRERQPQPRAIVIDEKLARNYFPGQDPIGRHLDDNQTRDKNPPPVTIIGVVGHTRNDAPGEQPDSLEIGPQITYCAMQSDQNDVMLMVRVTSGDPLRLTEPVRQAVLALDPELPIAFVSTMDANIATSLAPRRLTMVLLGTFAVLALVLASIGLYGVMALSVTQRTRELGIRLALGAQRSAVLALVMRQGAALVGVGLLIGLVGAVASGRLLASVLAVAGGGSEVPMLAAVAGVLAGAALLACWVPARRATKVDPMVALRNE